ncbi:DUF418 domain-containing protein [Streptomyces javensis]|uniref:DUF418 domain-containing protein n=1 Tax=Streptomyces javensis TaxID=114698 RepID=UPI0028124DC9|nr:DUF418 domain-containing protein [Streptomyces javensis]
MILCLTVAVDRLPVLRRLAAPVIAVGTVSLTLYVSHILVILALPGEAVTPLRSASFELLFCFVVGATLFAAIWSRFFHRGPLEYLPPQHHHQAGEPRPLNLGRAPMESPYTGSDRCPRSQP